MATEQLIPATERPAATERRKTVQFVPLMSLEEE